MDDGDSEYPRMQADGAEANADYLEETTDYEAPDHTMGVNEEAASADGAAYAESSDESDARVDRSDHHSVSSADNGGEVGSTCDEAATSAASESARDDGVGFEDHDAGGWTSADSDGEEAGVDEDDLEQRTGPADEAVASDDDEFEDGDVAEFDAGTEADVCDTTEGGEIASERDHCLGSESDADADAGVDDADAHESTSGSEQSNDAGLDDDTAAPEQLAESASDDDGGLAEVTAGSESMGDASTDAGLDNDDNDDGSNDNGAVTSDSEVVAGLGAAPVLSSAEPLLATYGNNTVRRRSETAKGRAAAGETGPSPPPTAASLVGTATASSRARRVGGARSSAATGAAAAASTPLCDPMEDDRRAKSAQIAAADALFGAAREHERRSLRPGRDQAQEAGHGKSHEAGRADRSLLPPADRDPTHRQAPTPRRVDPPSSAARPFLIDFELPSLEDANSDVKAMQEASAKALDRRLTELRGMWSERARRHVEAQEAEERAAMDAARRRAEEISRLEQQLRETRSLVDGARANTAVQVREMEARMRQEQRELEMELKRREQAAERRRGEERTAEEERRRAERTRLQAQVTLMSDQLEQQAEAQRAAQRRARDAAEAVESQLQEAREREAQLKADIARRDREAEHRHAAERAAAEQRQREQGQRVSELEARLHEQAEAQRAAEARAQQAVAAAQRDIIDAQRTAEKRARDAAASMESQLREARAYEARLKEDIARRDREAEHRHAAERAATEQRQREQGQRVSELEARLHEQAEAQRASEARAQQAAAIAQQELRKAQEELERTKSEVDRKLAEAKAHASRSAFLASGEPPARHIAFCLDVTGSMGRHQPEGLRAVDEALHSTLAAHGGAAKFAVICFRSNGRCESIGPMQVSAHNVQGAMHFLSGRMFNGGTAPNEDYGEALAKAMDILPELQEVYFFSDQGADCDMRVLYRAQQQKVRINALFLPGISSPNRTLQDMCSSTGGRLTVKGAS